MNLSAWEKSASNLLTSSVDKPSKNFHSIVVDVYLTDYGRYEVHVTTLFKKPFKQEDSDFYYSHRGKFQKYMKEFLPPLSKDDYYISQGASTIESYETTSKPYYEMKKKPKIEEQTLNILKKLNEGLISEASKKKVLIDKVGLSEENADYLDKTCGSLAVWMANKLIDLQLVNMASWRASGIETQLTKQNAIDKLNSGNLKNYYGQKVTEIMDWVRIGLDGNLGEYKNLSIEELLKKSKEWHDSLGIGGGEINYVEKNPIILDFRNKDGEGFYWVDLQTNNSTEECERMGHCGRTGYGNNLYSLRDVRKLPNGKYTINKSHLTASIGRDGTLYQLKGPKNSKPKEEFHSYILPLFYYETEDDGYLIDGFGTEYASERDFKLTDLPDSVIKDLYTNRPELFGTRSLQRKLIDLGVIEAPQINYHITLNIKPDDVGRYVDGDWVLNRRKVKKTTPAGQTYESTVETWLFETILSGDAWELWQPYEVDWKSSLQYEVNDENEKRIRNILKHIAQKDNPDFNEEDFNEESIEDLIKDLDDDYQIRSAISNATSNAESDDYVNYLYKELKGELEEYGQVEKMNDEGIILHVDVEPYIDNLDESYYDDYMERCDDDIECVFHEMLSEGDIDKPKFDTDDRWYPSIDTINFNDMLSDYLSDAEYHHTK
jgi:hypothetical protein